MRWSWFERGRVALLAAGIAFAAPLAAQPGASAPGFTAWARANAVPLRLVDDPYVDSSFNFLRPLVGSARTLALGELIHRGHEPLEFRNEVIKYAVTHLGFTAITLESGFTEAAAVDSFIHGGAGNVDSVLRAGLSWNFGTLPENRELVLWLREYNAHARRSVRFFGFDLTGADPANLADLYTAAPAAIVAPLDYLDRVDPAAGTRLRSRLGPLVDRFTPYHYAEYSVAERAQLRAGLDTLRHVLAADSSRYAQASSALYYARAVRNVWNAQQLNVVLAMTPSSSPAIVRARTIFRDSAMAENIRWVLRTLGDSGRVVVFAHNAHLMNAPMYDWTRDAAGNIETVGEPYAVAGQHLRAWLGAKEVVIVSTTSRIVGWGASASDSTSLDAALAKVGMPTFALDLRSGDRDPKVAAALRRPWPFRIHTMFERIVPRGAADAVVYFDQVTATKEQ